MKLRAKEKFIIVLTCASILVFGVTVRYAFFYAPTDEINFPDIFKYQGVPEAQAFNQQDNVFPSSYPKQLNIPSIKLNTKVQYVGITKKGNISTPNNFTDVGWYKYGAVPGENGSAIIAGHVNDGVDLPGVFGNLDNVKIGDDVYVNTIGGNRVHFVVNSIQTYDFNAPTEEIFNQNNGKFLKLITCAGVWSAQYKTHDKRLVVTAEQT